MILHWLVALTAVCVVIWTLLPILRLDAWWVRGFDFPRVQIAVIGGAVLLVYGALVGWQEPWDRWLMGALAASIVYQLVRIAPYTAWYPVQVRQAIEPDPDNTLALLVSNVLMTNRQADALLQLVRARKPDVLLTVETDRWWQDQLSVLEKQYPHTVKHPLDNLYGMHL